MKTNLNMGDSMSCRDSLHCRRSNEGKEHTGPRLLGLSGLALLMLLGGCSVFGHHAQTGRPRGVDGFPCAGEAMQLAADQGVFQYQGDLLKQSLGVSGHGGFCNANTWQLKKPLKVYRVWNKKAPETEYGHWWLLDKPNSLKDQYRFEYGQCTPAPQLNRLVSCEIAAGTVVAIGTTQNRDCEDGPHPKTSVNQVYVTLAGKHKTPVLLNCQDEGRWPDSRY